MDNQDFIYALIIGGGAILSVVGSIVYYFARYSIRTEYDEPSTVEATTVEAPSVELDRPKNLYAALASTRQSFWGRIKSVFGDSNLPDDLSDRLEEILYTSDLGPVMVTRLMEILRNEIRGKDRADVEQLHEVLRSEILKIIKQPENRPLKPLAKDKPGAEPTVWLIVGVNGVGKTTTIGKLAAQMAQGGQRVLVAAGDTFRAAAGEQLKIWSERAVVEIFSPPGVMDPAAVAYEACQKAKSGDFDLVLIDTAGRLHTQKNLMEELKKVKRVLGKLSSEFPHETLLVLDANSGQNALHQAREFHQALGVTGVILTKMDGTAKGGVALGIAGELNLPVRQIGVGEAIGDLRPFDPEEYVSAII